MLVFFSTQMALWRCGGSLANDDIPFSTIHLILLHKDHILTTLIVESAHARVLHDGVKELLTEVRSMYWIVNGRSFVRMIIH